MRSVAWRVARSRSSSWACTRSSLLMIPPYASAFLMSYIVYRACLLMEVAQLVTRSSEAGDEPLREGRFGCPLNFLLMARLEGSQVAIAQDSAVSRRPVLYTVHDGA